jgi:carboxylesterase type B
MRWGGETGGGLMAISRPESVKAAAKNQPEWPAHTAQTRATMEIDAECKVVNGPDPLERKLWERARP